MTLVLPRRRFLLGALATPAIVRASSLMPVRAWKEPKWPTGRFMFADGQWHQVMAEVGDALMLHLYPTKLAPPGKEGDFVEFNANASPKYSNLFSNWARSA